MSVHVAVEINAHLPHPVGDQQLVIPINDPIPIHIAKQRVKVRGGCPLAISIQVLFQRPIIQERCRHTRCRSGAKPFKNDEPSNPQSLMAAD